MTFNFKTENYDKTDLKKRHHIMRPLRNARFKYSEIRRLGFKVSRPLWRSCTNIRERNLG